ncbi:MAG: STAS domain-containing protein, partial [Fibrobacteres bacterium]|nr:STAS domain-containing protein [Fibrobacterota bacterium]
FLEEHKESKWNFSSGIRISNIGNFKIVSFEGAVPNMAEVKTFKDDMIRKVNTGMIFIAIDFSKVASVTSDFIGALLAIRRVVDMKDGWFVFIGVHDELYGIFDTVGLTKMISHYPDLKAFETALKGKDIISGIA